MDTVLLSTNVFIFLIHRLIKIEKFFMENDDKRVEKVERVRTIIFYINRRSPIMGEQIDTISEHN